jgi:hypothetical protein
MAGPIYKAFRVRFTEAWYQLSQEEQNSLLERNSESLKKAGGKPVMGCDSSWSSEQWPFFGVQEFPDIEAVQKHTAQLNEFNWFRYIESESLLGTKWDSSS